MSEDPPLETAKVAVLGAGSFGSVLADIMAKNGHDVRVWLRDEGHLSDILKERKNQRYLDGFVFDPSIRFSNDLAITVQEVDFVFLAVPSKAFRPLLAELKKHLKPQTALISTAKGVEAGTFKLMTEIVKDEMPNFKVAALSGPNLAAEIATGELTGSVVASSDSVLNQSVQNLLASSTFRVYDNRDLFGVELAGALKNVYAIASGMAHALGTGQNARSMLMTRSLAEMSRFAAAKGANPMTFLGLAGVGDLFVTCSSPLSRNFRFGSLIAQGESVDEALAEITSTVEGYATVQTVCEEANRLEIYMPLAKALHEVLYQDKDLLSALKELMLGENNHDVEFVNEEVL